MFTHLERVFIAVLGFSDFFSFFSLCSFSFSLSTLIFLASGLRLCLVTGADALRLALALAADESVELPELLELELDREDDPELEL